MSLAFLAVCGKAFAQDYSRLEVGIQNTSVAYDLQGGYARFHDGIGLRTTCNFSSWLSLDAEGSYMINDLGSSSQWGGRAFLLLAGPKASFREGRFNFFATARPGFADFTGVTSITSQVIGGKIYINELEHEHRAHLALDLGAGVEVNTSRRTFLLFDVSEMLLRYGDRTYHVPNTNLDFLSQGSIGNSQRFAAGFGYRLGALRRDGTKTTSDGTKRWSAGVQYGVLSSVRASVVGPGSSYNPDYIGDDPGVGGFVSYSIKPWLDVESALTYFYSFPRAADAQRGGTMLEGVLGPKLGFRTRKIGFFVKARPGVLSYSAAFDDFIAPYPTQRLTHFAFDTGGVLEYYPTRHVVLRFDMGALIVRYGPVKVTAQKNVLFPNGSFTQPGFVDTGMQFTTGFGWRF